MKRQTRPQTTRSAAMTPVADDGVARSGCVDANLMGSTRLERGVDEAHPARLRPSYEPRGRGLAIDGRDPGALRSWIARDDGVVAALDGAGLKCPRNRWVGPLVQGEQHQSARGCVEAVVQSDI